ncbi:MAG: DUF5979 domain-containing protein, partial [Clostridia bacterium]|nr:DUF5979 domain-containing protein [Clostridia bacterium]
MEFTIHAIDDGSNSYDIGGAFELPYGMKFTLKETDAKGYGPSYYSINPSDLANIRWLPFDPETGMTGMLEFTPENGYHVNVFILNTKNVGSLTVTKTVTGNAADPDKEFSFTVTLDDDTINGEYGDMTFENGVATVTLKGGESATANDLPEGVGYTVTEGDYANDGYVLVGENNLTGTITADEIAKAEFTNKRDAFGGLTVSKTVSGNTIDPDKEFSFTVTLDDDTINGEYGDMTFANGVATVELKHG